MLCKNCAETLNEWDKFCPNCGMRTDEDEGIEDFSEREQPGEEAFEDDFDDLNKRSPEGFYENISAVVNEKLDGLLHWSAEGTPSSFWILFAATVIISIVFSEIGVFLHLGDSFNKSSVAFGGFIGAILGVIISYLIEKFMLWYISGRIDFPYGRDENMKDERNSFLMIATAIKCILAWITQFVPLRIGWIVFLFLAPVCSTSVFYRYFRGDELKQYVKRYLIITIIVAVVLGILLFVLMVMGISALANLIGSR